MNAIANTPIAAQLASKRLSRTDSVRILVATDGSETSVAAYRAAELIVSGLVATQRRARVHVLSVMEPLPVVVPPLGAPVFAPSVSRAREDELRTDMVEQLLKLGRLAEWTTEIRVGTPAEIIAEVATQHQVDLIIIGASHHGIVDRLLGEETATHLARLVERPLLVATPAMSRLPRRVIVALDLAPANRPALVRALEILGSPEGITCLHVEPRSEALGVDWAEYDGEYRAEVERAFGKVNAALTSLPRVESELVIMHGEVARETNEFSDNVKAEMIVLGVKRRGQFSVAPGRGIAMRVLRAARCSVLLVPNPANLTTNSRWLK
jgi:nucleotide-binding universal stress UspA family protein